MASNRIGSSSMQQLMNQRLYEQQQHVKNPSGKPQHPYNSHQPTHHIQTQKLEQKVCQAIEGWLNYGCLESSEHHDGAGPGHHFAPLTAAAKDTA